MADAKISALPSATVPLAGTEVLPVVQGGTTDKVAAADLLRQNGQTVTTSNPVLNLAQTWNAGAVAFTGLKFNATNTASAAGSLLLDLQTDGVTRFAVGHASAAPYILTAAQAGIERFRVASQSSGASVEIYAGGINSFLGFGTPGSTDTNLFRDAANTLALRNGVNAQTFRVYNTYTDASNYERGLFAWGGGALYIGSEKAGTGATRAVTVLVGGTSAWSFDTSRNFVAAADNGYDIGASGANRPRTGYFGTSAVVGAFPAGQPVAALNGYGATWSFIGSASATDSADKALRLGGAHYSNAEEPVLALYSYSSVNANGVNIGGGSSSGNAATTIGFYTAANNTTTTGTFRWQIDRSGHFVAGADNTYDIGASGANRVRSGYFGTSIEIGGSAPSGSASLTSFGRTWAMLGCRTALTDATTKSMQVGLPHYTIAEEPLFVIGGAVSSTGGEVYIGGSSAASNAATSIYFYTAADNVTVTGTARWLINSNGHYLAGADNTYDIGASGANRPRTVYAATSFISGGSVQAANAGSFQFASRGDIAAPSDGVFTLRNNAATDFTRLQFGGTTSAFPALRKQTGGIGIRLADDSAYAGLFASEVVGTSRVYAHSSTAIPAGGATGVGLYCTSAGGFGVFFGSGAPTLSAAKGSLYLRSDGTTTNDRMYVNTDGSTTWTAVTTAA